jgi:hypothetical protein
MLTRILSFGALVMIMAGCATDEGNYRASRSDLFLEPTGDPVGIRQPVAPQPDINKDADPRSRRAADPVVPSGPERIP